MFIVRDPLFNFQSLFGRERIFRSVLLSLIVIISLVDQTLDFVWFYSLVEEYDHLLEFHFQIVDQALILDDVNWEWVSLIQDVIFPQPLPPVQAVVEYPIWDLEQLCS